LAIATAFVPNGGCEEVHLNLAYRWFCRLGLDGEVPDHSTFSKNRHGRFRDCDLLRKLFETVVRRCMAEGLVEGAAFAVDASLIAADANKQRSTAGSDDVDWEAIAKLRSVREYLDRRGERDGTEVHLRPHNGSPLKAGTSAIR
jgi:IS5 family transposase